MSSPDHITIIYDHDCPFCREYTHLMRLKNTIGTVELINARDAPDMVHKLLKQSIDIDKGMVVLYHEDIHHGAEAMHMLALLSSRLGWFNRINYWIFRSPTASRLLYPILRFGRTMVLRIMGVHKIND